MLRWFLHENGLPPPSHAPASRRCSRSSPRARDDARVSLRTPAARSASTADASSCTRAPPARFERAVGGRRRRWCCRTERSPADAAERDGLDPARLFAAPVTVRSRAGGERLRTRAGGPLRELKDVLREAGVPAWDRAALPLVFAGPVLAAVPGIASDPDYAAAPGGAPGVRLVWSPHAA